MSFKTKQVQARFVFWQYQRNMSFPKYFQKKSTLNNSVDKDGLTWTLNFEIESEVSKIETVFTN